MAPIDVVHLVGSSIYAVFLVLFFWLNRFPRTHSVAIWWALAMLCLLSARLSLLLPDWGAEERIAEAVYIAFVVLEKLFLVTGLIRLLALDSLERYCRGVALLALVWLVAGVGFDLAVTTVAWGVVLFNSSALGLLAVLAYRYRHRVPKGMLVFTALVAAVFSVYWLSYPSLRFEPETQAAGFVTGMVFSVLLYLSLIGALLLLFQQRLLDAESRALELAYLDPLTGLNNQRYMTKLFEDALLLATRPHQSVALIYIDLDNFKPINDRAGHCIGDEVLKIVAQRLREHTRSTDICARLGGDEFVVIATQLNDAAHVHDIAAKLLARLKDDIQVGGQHYNIGASIGISLYPTHGEALAQLLEKADQAMYQIKKHGKSGYQLFDA
ncbi:GGDEF domain-containing protein [Marinobacter sp. CA1]|uniref:GGDEF domain-containing protein n=1 Tax=Marinobacter sp. CA1 TaxID=2817656 RepID=UPI001D08F825|nr:GGDEF domain-containing protein [Marinobacter sp. CA1]UDL04961.1 GGDEF domain-containing protein [Marinobacter sp. CA1]